MERPDTNRPLYRPDQHPTERALSNVKAIEERMRTVDWRVIGKFYAVGFGVATLSLGVFLFVIVASVRAALALF